MNPLAVILIFAVAGLGCWLFDGLIKWWERGNDNVDTDPETLDD